MSVQIVLFALCALVVLWFALKVVRVAFRLLKYVLLFGLAGFLVWYLLFRH